MNIEFIKKIAIAALPIAVVSSGMLFATASTSEATTVNNNIHINKSRLKGKCKRSGGTFFDNGKNRSYGCTSGSGTVVVCKKTRNCIGVIPRETGKRRKGAATSGLAK